MGRTVERRFRQGPSPEVRAATSGGGGPTTITGYAAIFDSPSEDMGFVETIDPAAFRKSLADGADVRALANHDPNQLLGRVKSGTLRLSADQRGLGYEIDVNEADPEAVGVLERVRRGDLDGSSFSFQTIRDEWNMTATPPQRRLLEVALIDVGPVTYPAYSAATSEARSILDQARLRRAPRAARAERELELLGLRAGIRAGSTPTASGVVRPGLVPSRNMFGARPPATANPTRVSHFGPASVAELARRVELVGLEVRAGKTISAATAQVLLDIVEKLEQLLVDAGAIEPADAA